MRSKIRSLDTIFSISIATSLAVLLGISADCEAAPAAASKKAAEASTRKVTSAPAGAVTFSNTSVNANLTPDEQVNVRVYKQANRGVVNIAPVTDSDIFYNVEPQGGMGSGSIISADGYILTNHHVIEQARQIRVTLYDGTMVQADLVGQDPSTDLAVIKIAPIPNKKLTVIPMGDSAHLEVGRRVFAIGNPFGLDRSMTTGIISSLSRTYQTENHRVLRGIIQTDAAINPGNSGGPLLDSAGQMIGITSAIFSKAGQSAGIGFAIPTSLAKKIIPELIAHHGISRPDIGLQVMPTERGLFVVRVEPNSPAAEAGLSGPKLKHVTNGVIRWSIIDGNAADIITSIDNTPIHSEDDLLSYIEQKKPGQVVTLTVLRGGKVMKVQVKLTTAGPIS
ncbi:MAG TPA: trypsin-like peptidase domain-containing protein [Oculatellaceae cyanobacterium]